jgi:glycine betaine/choline ABC-type transport system substrate-binding protein
VTTQPGLLPALGELSGKISTEKMRGMNAQVDIGHLSPSQTAAAFLETAGLSK